MSLFLILERSVFLKVGEFDEDRNRQKKWNTFISADKTSDLKVIRKW